MVTEEFRNIDTVVRLDWFVKEFDSRLLRYRLVGDDWLIKHIIEGAGQGRIALAMMKRPLQKLVEGFKLDLDYETIDVQVDPPDGPWCSIRYLSFGTRAEELAKTCATKFVVQLLKEKMSITVPSLTFKAFWLPPLPVATTDEGHIMYTVRGIANIRKKTVEINVRAPRDYKSMFNTLVHEIIHICFLGEGVKEDAGIVESRIDAYEKTFFKKCQRAYESQKDDILESLRSAIEKGLYFFREADRVLEESERVLMQANYAIKTFSEFLDAILDEKIKPVQI